MSMFHTATSCAEVEPIRGRSSLKKFAQSDWDFSGDCAQLITKIRCLLPEKFTRSVLGQFSNSTLLPAT